PVHRAVRGHVIADHRRDDDEEVHPRLGELIVIDELRPRDGRTRFEGRAHGEGTIRQFRNIRSRFHANTPTAFSSNSFETTSLVTRFGARVTYARMARTNVV